MINVTIKNRNNKPKSKFSVASKVEEKLDASGGTLSGSIEVATDNSVEIGSADKQLKAIYVNDIINNNSLQMNNVTIDIVEEEI